MNEIRSLSENDTLTLEIINDIENLEYLASFGKRYYVVYSFSEYEFLYDIPFSINFYFKFSTGKLERIKLISLKASYYFNNYLERLIKNSIIRIYGEPTMDDKSENSTISWSFNNSGLINLVNWADTKNKEHQFFFKLEFIDTPGFK